MKSSSIAPDLGTLAWGKKKAGKLNSAEKGRIVANIAYLQIREACDGARQSLGGLRPQPLDLDDLSPPQTSLVTDALHLAEATHEQPLLFHSWRVYFFGAMLAAHERIEFDRSIFFASAILHDIGLTKDHSPKLCDCCFAISGGARVQEYLCTKGHPPATSDKIGNAIALHLNAWVSKTKHGAEAHLVSRGAVCDVFGAGRRRLPKGALAQLLSRFPRTGVIEGLQYETADHFPGSRPAVMTRLTGGKAPPDPFRV